jgi:hypothetical protein
VKNVVNRDLISAISQNQSTSETENNFWIDMTGYDFTRFSFQGDIEAHPPCLMNISTGMHATREVHDSLLSAVNEGEKKGRKFANSALSVGQSVSLYSPISKSQLKTFEHMNAKTSLK